MSYFIYRFVIKLAETLIPDACSVNQLFWVLVINRYNKAWHFPPQAHTMLVKCSHTVCKAKKDEPTYPLDVLHHLLDVGPDHLCLFPKSKESIIWAHWAWTNTGTSDFQMKVYRTLNILITAAMKVQLTSSGQRSGSTQGQALFSLNARKSAWQYWKWGFSLFPKKAL